MINSLFERGFCLGFVAKIIAGADEDEADDEHDGSLREPADLTAILDELSELLAATHVLVLAVADDEATSVDESDRCSGNGGGSFGIRAIFCTNIFSKVCAMMTTSSPGLL